MNTVLSSAQRRFLLLDRLRPGAEYNLQLALVLTGEVDVAAMAQALADVVARHEPLHTRFEVDADGRPGGVADPAAVPVLDTTPASGGEDAAAVAAAELAIAFDLLDGPPVRARLARLADGACLLAITVHHAAFDGASGGVLLHELGAAYAARAAGTVPCLPVLDAPYSAEATAEAAELAARRDEMTAFWRVELAGVEELNLPVDKAGRGRGAPLGRAVAPIHPTTVVAVDQLARACGATPVALTLAAYGSVLGRYGDQTDVVIGTPATTRGGSGAASLVGPFVNTLPLRVRFRRQQSFRSLVRDVHDATNRAIPHRLLPFEDIVRELSPDRHPDANPLFNTFCSVLGAAPPATGFAGLEADLVVAPYATARLPLSATFVLDPGDGELQLEYSEELFDAETAAQLARHVVTFVDWAVRRPDDAVEALPLMPPAERRAVLATASAPAPGAPAREVPA